MQEPIEDIARSVERELYERLIARRNQVGIVGPPAAREIALRARKVLQLTYQINNQASEMSGPRKEGKLEKCRSVRVLVERLLIALEDLERLL